jgi:phosphoglycolate phosphatase-like HAD superfamily hydrolase
MVMTDIIFDVDGTLMNVDKRVQYAKDTKRDTDRYMNWDNFLDPKIMLEYDTPNKDVCYTANSLRDNPRNRIIITSARNERHREVTMIQLSRVSVKYETMYLRDDDDFRPDDIVKEELLSKIRTSGYDPTIAFDDRNQVVKMWRKLGINCYQVREGDF